MSPHVVEFTLVGSQATEPVAMIELGEQTIGAVQVTLVTPPPPPAGTVQPPVAFRKLVAAAPLLPGTSPCAVLLVLKRLKSAVTCAAVRSSGVAVDPVLFPLCVCAPIVASCALGSVPERFENAGCAHSLTPLASTPSAKLFPLQFPPFDRERRGRRRRDGARAGRAERRAVADQHGRRDGIRAARERGETPPPPAGTLQAPVALRKLVAAAPLLPGTSPLVAALVLKRSRSAVSCVAVRSSGAAVLAVLFPLCVCAGIVASREFVMPAAASASVSVSLAAVPVTVTGAVPVTVKVSVGLVATGDVPLEGATVENELLAVPPAGIAHVLSARRKFVVAAPLLPLTSPFVVAPVANVLSSAVSCVAVRSSGVAVLAVLLPLNVCAAIVARSVFATGGARPPPSHGPTSHAEPASLTRAMHSVVPPPAVQAVVVQSVTM